MNYVKYKKPEQIHLPDRQWPSQTIDVSPIWCSVDLRDGNQALPNPLSPEEKMEYFKLLCKIGFKEIEISFPAASLDDFTFTRKLIDNGLIPDDVFVMVLTQCRQHLIEKTLESISGIKQGIFHAYCATSDLHIHQVLKLNRRKVVKMISNAVELAKDIIDTMSESDIRLEFSPEEFTDTDLEFSLDVCEAVFETWGRATIEKPLILNLPSTVERRPPNQYADMIEWFCRKFSHRNEVIISLHAHNDQGMAVAATELSLMAGAERVEGTLFGHGERTGNVDLVTVINNFMCRGIKTGIDFSNMSEIISTIERLTNMPVYYRQPYSGKYVYTAFSGSHQDAINKGMSRLNESAKRYGVRWKVPYLHVDPADFGRKYENLIHINSQSGKGGMAWVLEQNFFFKIPQKMLPELGSVVQRYLDKKGREISSDELYEIFQKEFINPDGHYKLVGYWPQPDNKNPSLIHGKTKIRINNQEKLCIAVGNGPISAFVKSIQKFIPFNFTIADFQEQTIGTGADAFAAAYVSVKVNDITYYGVGIDTNITQASIKAVISSLNRIVLSNEVKEKPDFDMGKKMDRETIRDD